MESREDSAVGGSLKGSILTRSFWARVEKSKLETKEHTHALSNACAHLDLICIAKSWLIESQSPVWYKASHEIMNAT